jgi:hypothetical protein
VDFFKLVTRSLAGRVYVQTCHMRREVPWVMVQGTLFLPIGDVNYCFITGLEICS